MQMVAPPATPSPTHRPPGEKDPKPGEKYPKCHKLEKILSPKELGDPEQEESPPQGQDELLFHAQEHSTCSVGHELVTGVSVQTQHSPLHIILANP